MPIRSLWQTDWVEGSPGGAWNLILPGPSLEETIDQADPSYPTMAVSHAIRAPHFAEYWVDWEGPNDTRHGNAWLNRAKGPPNPSTIITAGRHAKTWHKWFSKRRFGDPLIVGQAKIDPIPDPWRDARLDQGPAWVLAIRAMVLRGAARLIYVYGMDLEGEGYAYGAPDYRRRSPAEWEGRWVGERNLLLRMAELLDGIEVELVRVKPPIPDPES